MLAQAQKKLAANKSGNALPAPAPQNTIPKQHGLPAAAKTPRAPKTAGASFVAKAKGPKP